MPPHLLLVDQKIVRPADIGRETSHAGDGGLRSKPGCQREPASPSISGIGGRNQNTDIQPIASGGVPAMVAASASGGLFIGYPDTACGRRLCAASSAKSIGRADGRKVLDLSANVVPARAASTAGRSNGITASS